MSKALKLGIVAFLLGILGNLLAGWIQEDVIGTFTPVGIVFIILLTIAGLFVGARSEQETEGDDLPGVRPGVYWLLVGVIIGVITVASIVVVLSGKTERQPSTVYFIIDATEKMQPLFHNVRTQVQVATSLLRDDSKVGLRVYGGDSNSTSNCQGSRQLLPLNTYANVAETLNLQLESINPSGHSSMTGAALEAFFSDLQNEAGPAQLLLITSGIDPLCDPPAADFLKDRAKDVGQNVQLLIISIGEQDQINNQIFESYADAFGGSYITIPNPERLPAIISTVSAYGYGYSSSGINVTPQP